MYANREIMIFKNIQKYNELFQKIPKKNISNIEYNIFKRYQQNRVLLTAEHAFTERIPAPDYGKHAFIGLGDKNVDILATMGAFYSKSAYIIPRLSRLKVDFARNPKTIGTPDKENRLFVKVSYARKPQKIYMRIHNDKNYLPVLIKYINLIEQLKPRFILSYHGMHSRHEPDILFGANSNFSYLGGKSKSKEFVSFVRKRIAEKSDEFGFKIPLKIGLSELFAGDRNYILNRFASRGIKGCQVEFNLRGRVSEKRRMPVRKFQLAAQVIPECIEEFQW